MDENDPRFVRYCQALYALHRCLGEVAAGRRPEAPSYAGTLAERRDVRSALATLVDATIANGMTAAQFLDVVRTIAGQVLAPHDDGEEGAVESPAIASFLFDAGLEYSAALVVGRREHPAPPSPR